MADEVFRPKKPSIQDIDNAPVAEGHPLYGVQQMQRMAAEDHHVAAVEMGHESPQTPFSAEPGIDVAGQVPQAFLDALKRQRAQQQQQPTDEMPPLPQQPRQRQREATNPHRMVDNNGLVNNTQLLEIMKRLEGHTHNYDEVVLPSLGRFYDGTDGPVNGIVHIRQMTGEEEEILGQPRYIKRGKAIDMIFEKCIREPIQADRLLGVDRTYLLVYLRGISYTQYYEVEVKCPECSNDFNTTIDLNALSVERCPDNFDEESLSGVLPSSGLRFSYRLSRGDDETQVQHYREKMNKEFGDRTSDDTSAFRTSLLLDEIEGIRDKVQIKLIAKKLPIGDLNYIRNLVNDPPFGVNTEIELNCPSCVKDFSIDLPFESNFFFPRRRKSVPRT